MTGQAFESFIKYTSLATKISLLLTMTFSVSTLLTGPAENVLALGTIALLVYLHLEKDINSLQLALISLAGLVFSSFSIPQLFFIGLLGYSLYVLVAKEGLLYYFSRSTVHIITDSSILDGLGAAFNEVKDIFVEHDGDGNNAEKSDSDSDENTDDDRIRLGVIRTTAKLVSKKGFAFACLPKGARWALLPVDMRESYEEKRIHMLKEEAGFSVNTTKYIGWIERNVGLFMNSEARWLGKSAYHVQRLIFHPQVTIKEDLLDWKRKHSASVEEIFGEEHQRGRIGALLGFAAVVTLISLKMRGN